MFRRPYFPTAFHCYVVAMVTSLQIQNSLSCLLCPLLIVEDQQAAAWQSVSLIIGALQYGKVGEPDT